MWIALGVLVIIVLMLVLNYIIFHRSFIASIVEFYLRVSPFKRRTLSKIIAKKERAKKYKIPKLKCKIQDYIFNDMPTYVLSNKMESDIVVLYLHGGAYVNKPLKYHWRFCDNLVRKLGITIVFPLYPLAPEHTFEEAHSSLIKLYREILVKHSGKVIIMGDSAGGGLATSLCMSFKEEGIKQPAKLILLSPWLDITLSNKDMTNYDKVDPMLGRIGLIEFGQAWAGKLDYRDYRVSPMFGDINRLENIYLFVGTREILYPDIVKFYDKCKREKVTIKLFVERGMNHVYPIYPIPEAKKAFKQIKNIILENYIERNGEL